MITKKDRLATGVVDYFRNALAAIGRHSALGNLKYPPADGAGELRWSFDVSTAHADAIMSHLSQRGEIDPETGFSHTVALAWRALALLETEEIAKGATPGRAVLRAAHPALTPELQAWLPPTPEGGPDFVHGGLLIAHPAQKMAIAAFSAEELRRNSPFAGLSGGPDEEQAEPQRRVFRAYRKSDGGPSHNYPAAYADRETLEQIIRGNLIGVFYEQHRAAYEIREENE